MHWRTFVAVLALTGAHAVHGLAATPPERATTRAAVEKQIQEVDARLSRSRSEGRADAPDTELARSCLATARELLKLGNVRAAGALVMHARRLSAPPVGGVAPSTAAAVQP